MREHAHAAEGGSVVDIEGAGWARQLGDARARLSGSFVLQETLEALADLCVPACGDFCVVEVGGSLERPPTVVLRHRDQSAGKDLHVLRDAVVGLRGATRLLHTDEHGASELVRTLASHGLRSAILVPLVGPARELGTLFIGTESTGRRLNEHDLALVEALARVAGPAVDNALAHRVEQQARLAAERLYDAERTARAAAEKSRARYRVLAEASSILSSSLDYESTLQAVAQLVVPALADWCFVDVVEGEGLRRMAVAHVESTKVELGFELERRYPTDVRHAQGVAAVLRTCQPELQPTPDAAWLAGRAVDEAHADLWRSLGLRSFLCVPLVAAGRAIGVMSVGLSDTSRRFDEPEFELVQELGRRAGLAVDNARLYREAKEASRLKDEFLATVSHELRTPLNAILGWTRLLRSGELDERTTVRALETVERNALLQSKIVGDILDIARIIAGKLRLNVQAVDLAHVIETAVETVRPAANARQMTLVTDLDHGAAHVSGDADRLQQVVWNLLSNAIKFTPPGGRVEVSLSRAPSGARLAVRDNGRGIGDDFLPYVFDRFRQAESTTTRAHGGLGLGLAIVRHFVELHGGTVHAESDGLGRGATFVVHLPIRALRLEPTWLDDTGESRERVAYAYEGDVHLEGLRVLVVDDDGDARELLCAVLGRYGADVISAGSVREAYESLRERRPDLVLSDIAMPGEDGYDLIRRVRALPEGAGGRVPAAALTAYAREVDRQRAIDAGYDAHLAKPLEPLELVAAVQALVGRRSRV